MAEFVKRLSLLGTCHDDELAVIGLNACTRIHEQSFLLLVNVEVYKTGLAIVQNRACNLGHCAVLKVGCTGEPPGKGDALCLFAEYFLYYRLGDWLFLLILEDRDGRIGFPVSEVFLQDLDHLVRIEVTRYANGYVVGNIVLIVVFLHIGDGRILEVLLTAESGLLAVRMVREKGLGNYFPDLAAVLGKGHILFLIDGLKFGMETANNSVTETVGLDAGPVVDLVGGDVLDVHGFVVAGKCIGAVGSDHGHELVVLIGDGDLGGFVADGVDTVVYGCTLGRVFGLAVLFKKLLNLVQEGLFGGIIGGAEILGALEHKMLKVMGKSCGLGRIVLASHFDGNVGLNAGLLFVNRHKHLHTIVESVDFSPQRVVGHGFVLIARNGRDANR